MTGAALSILLAAGGTGGHMMPARALASELKRRGHACILVTDRRGAGVPGAIGNIRRHCLDAGRMTGGPLRKLSAGARLGVNILRARRLLRSDRPAAAVGFGGYPALSALLAARSLRIPYLLHEQNAVLGRANRFLAGGAAAIALSYPDTRRVPGFATSRGELTGLPVRDEIAALAEAAYAPPAEDDPFRLLVLGGSLGARVLSEVVPAALARLPGELRGRLEISQQCRSEDLEAVRARYAEAGIAADLARYFEDVPERLRRTHLAIARAGASTLAELAAAGRPVILVPLPIATDDHQSANAAAVTVAGAGWTLSQAAFTPDVLAERLQALMCEPGRLRSASEAARGLGRPHAAAALADLVERVAARAGSAEAGRAGSTGRPPPRFERREALA